MRIERVAEGENEHLETERTELIQGPPHLPSILITDFMLEVLTVEFKANNSELACLLAATFWPAELTTLTDGAACAKVPFEVVVVVVPLCLSGSLASLTVEANFSSSPALSSWPLGSSG